jgi:uncharacterized protein YkwD
MNIRIFGCWTGLLFWSGIVAVPALAAPDSTPKRQPEIAWFNDYDATSFRKLEAASQRIDPQRVDLNLLDAAVFHETNRRRQRDGLRPLACHAKAREMARMQSRAMAQQRFVGHTNPREPKKKALSDRAQLVDLRPSFLAENVATAFGRRYESGAKFFVREENGEKVYSHRPDGPPIPMHSYLSFAEALVDGWMASFGHRANILHKSPQYLGCACQSAKDESAMETFYCAQVFFAPLQK